MSQASTVFVVDDDRAVRDSIVLLLESENLTAKAFPCGEAFLDYYKQDSPGCLVLDISMPGMSGLELQEILKSRQISIPVIFITGHGDVAMSVRALKCGAFDFIEKPFSNEELVACVNAAITWNLERREKQARKVAEAVSAYAQSIVETVREPLLVFDEQLNFLTANRSFYKTFQVSITNNEQPALAQFAKNLWQSEALKLAIEKAITTETELFDYEVLLLFPSIGQKHLRINVGELRHLSNQAKRYLMAIEDITQRKRAEERSQALLESAPDAIVVTNDNGNIQLVNEQAEKTFGFAKHELIGKPLEILIPTRFQGKHTHLRNNYFSNPRRMPMGSLRILSALRKNGKEFPVEVSLSPYEAEDGLLVISSIRDVTERVKIEDELKQHKEHLEDLVEQRTAQLEASNKELESYSYSIAHDLRAPLRSMTSFSQLLIEDAKERLSGDEIDYLERVISAGKKMSQLIDEILELSRITRTQLHFGIVDLSKLANDILYRLRISQKDKLVSWNVHDELVVKGDLRLLEVVLQNLIENAWKYTRDKTLAVIEVGKTNIHGQTVYYVKDNGVGFNMQFKDNLFKPFHRLHSLEEFEGTGVGLATVERIVQRHGGRVWADAQLNKGATFYFTLCK